MFPCIWLFVRQELLYGWVQRESKTDGDWCYIGCDFVHDNIQQSSIFVVHNCKDHHQFMEDSEVSIYFE